MPTQGSGAIEHHRFHGEVLREPRQDRFAVGGVEAWDHPGSR